MIENIISIFTVISLILLFIWYVKLMCDDIYKKGFNDGRDQGRQEMINQYEYQKPWLTQDNYNGIWR